MNNKFQISIPRKINPSIYMDSRGLPHVVWVDGEFLCYSYFSGIRWQFLGGSKVILRKSCLLLDEHPVLLDSDGFPSIGYRCGNALYVISWNGNSWEVNNSGSPVIFGNIDSYCLAKCVDQSYIFYTAQPTGVTERRIYATQIDGTQISSYLLPNQGYSGFDLLAKPVEDTIHVFWNARPVSFDQSSGSSNSLSSASISSVSRSSKSTFSMSLSSSSKGSWSQSTSSTSSVISSSSISSSSQTSLSTKSSISSASSSSMDVCHSWVGHAIFNTAVGSWTNNVYARIDASCGCGEITGFDFFARESIVSLDSFSSMSSQSFAGSPPGGGIVTWTRSSSRQGSVHACWLEGLTESCINPNEDFLISKYTYPKIGFDGEGFRSPLYQGPVAYINNAGAPRLFCVSEGVAVFKYGEDNFSETRRVLPTFYSAKKIAIAPYRQSQALLCAYLSNGDVFVHISPDEDFSSSSTSLSSISSSSLSSSTVVNQSSSSSSISSPSSKSSRSSKGYSSGSSVSSTSSSTQSDFCQNCECYYGVPVFFRGTEVVDPQGNGMFFEAQFSSTFISDPPGYVDFSVLDYAADSMSDTRQWEYFRPVDRVMKNMPTEGLPAASQSVTQGFSMHTFPVPAPNTVYYIRRRSFNGVDWGEYRFSQQVWGGADGATMLPVDISGAVLVDPEGNPIHLELQVSDVNYPDFRHGLSFNTNVSQDGWLFSNGETLQQLTVDGLQSQYQHPVLGFVGFTVEGVASNALYFLRYRSNGGNYYGRVAQTQMDGQTFLAINMVGDVLQSTDHLRIDISLCQDFSQAVSYYSHIPSPYRWYYWDYALEEFKIWDNGSIQKPLPSTARIGNERACVAFIWEGAEEKTAYYIRWRPMVKVGENLNEIPQSTQCMKLAT